MIVTDQELADYLPAARNLEETAMLPLITAAAQTAVEQYIGQKIESGARVEKFLLDAPVDRLWLSHVPVSAVTVTIDGDTVDAEIWDADGGVITFDGPVTGNAAVSYTGGWSASTVPEPLRLCVLHVISREWFRMRSPDASGGVDTVAESDQVGSTSKRLSTLQLDSPSRLLCDGYRRIVPA